MNEIDKEYILNQLNDGYIDLGIYDEKEIEYLKLVVSNYENLQSKIDKAIEYYETHQKECVIGRNRDDKLIKDYYLPSQFSKKLYDILKEDE